MATVEQRISYLEGQVVLLPQMVAQVAERLDRVEAALGQRIDRVEVTLHGEMSGLRGDVVQLGRTLDSKMSKQFYWLVGIQISLFVTILAAILGALYVRG